MKYYIDPQKLVLIKYITSIVMLLLVCVYVLYKSYVRQFDSGFYLFSFSAIANYVYADKCYNKLKELSNKN